MKGLKIDLALDSYDFVDRRVTRISVKCKNKHSFEVRGDIARTLRPLIFAGHAIQFQIGNPRNALQGVDVPFVATDVDLSARRLKLKCLDGHKICIKGDYYAKAADFLWESTPMRLVVGKPEEKAA